MIFTELTTLVYQFKHMTNTVFWAEAVSWDNVADKIRFGATQGQFFGKRNYVLHAF